MTTQDARLAEYNRNVILSATPAQLLTMLYDRLVLDMHRAEEAQRREDWAEARVQLLHAQDIITELSSSLTVDAWDGGPDLFAIYTYVRTALANANITRDASLTRESIRLIEPLRDAWHAAAEIAAVPPAAPRGALGVG